MTGKSLVGLVAAVGVLCGGHAMAAAANRRRLSARWSRRGPDGNAFSFYYYSRLDIHLANGQPWDCEGAP